MKPVYITPKSWADSFVPQWVKDAYSGPVQTTDWYGDPVPAGSTWYNGEFGQEECIKYPDGTVIYVPKQTDVLGMPAVIKKKVTPDGMVHSEKTILPTVPKYAKQTISWHKNGNSLTVPEPVKPHSVIDSTEHTIEPCDCDAKEDHGPSGLDFDGDESYIEDEYDYTQDPGGEVQAEFEYAGTATVEPKFAIETLKAKHPELASFDYADFDSLQAVKQYEALATSNLADPATIKNITDALAGMVQKISSLQARIEKLEAMKPIPGPKGDKGDKGDPAPAMLSVPHQATITMWS